MDEKLASAVVDGLVKVVWVNAGTWGISRGTWVVSFGAGHYHLTYDRKEEADNVAESIRMLAVTAIRRYNGASSKTEPPPMPLDGLMPDLFAGELEAVSKILGRVSGLLGREARRLVDLRQAIADLAAEADTVARCMPEGSSRDFLLLKVAAVVEALSALEKG